MNGSQQLVTLTSCPDKLSPADTLRGLLVTSKGPLKGPPWPPDKGSATGRPRSPRLVMRPDNHSIGHVSSSLEARRGAARARSLGREPLEALIRVDDGVGAGVCIRFATEVIQI